MSIENRYDLIYADEAIEFPSARWADILTAKTFVPDPVPLPKEVTDEMMLIIKRIELGIYRHNQDTWHCGTSHCFFGWKIAIDVAKYLNAIPETLDFSRDPEVTRAEYELYYSVPAKFVLLNEGREGAITGYVMQKWGLNRYEKYWFASGRRTLSELRQGVERLQQGYRITSRTLINGTHWTRKYKNEEGKTFYDHTITF